MCFWEAKAGKMEGDWGIDKNSPSKRLVGGTFISRFFFSPQSWCHSDPQEKETSHPCIPTAPWIYRLFTDPQKGWAESLLFVDFRWWEQDKHSCWNVLLSASMHPPCRKPPRAPIPPAKMLRNSRVPSSKLEQKIVIFISLLSSICNKSLFLSGPGTDPHATADLQIFLIDLSVWNRHH